MNRIIKKWNALPLTFKASFVYLLASVVQKGLAFITSPIFTRILTSEEYGTVSVFFSLEQLIGTVAMFSLSAGCFDIGMQDYKEDRDCFCFSILILSNIITVVSAFLILILYPILDAVLGISRFLLIVMFVVFLFQPAFIFWTRRERFEYHYRFPGIITIISAILSSVIAVVCIVEVSSNRIEVRIIGQYIPLLIIYIFFWFFLGIRTKFKVNREYIKFAFWFNLPLIPHYLSSYVLNSSDRLMINRMVGPSQAAYYSLAYSVSALVTIIWTAINSSIVPYVLEKYERKLYKQASDTVLSILIFFACGCLIIILIAPEILGLLGPEEYHESIYVIPPVIAGVFFQSLYYVLTNVLYYLKKPQIVMYASVGSAVLNIILNYVCIKCFGYIAAGYTTCICFGMQALVDYIVVRRILGEDIYDKKYLITLSLLVVGFTLVSNLVYGFVMIRYIIIAILLFSLFMKRSSIIGLFKSTRR